LNPVVARLLIHGMNPFDLERVLRSIENVPLRNARQLEALWLREWERLAETWASRAREAADTARRQTALSLSFQSCCCHLAQFLINPGDLTQRRQIVEGYAASYRRTTEFFESPCRSVEIPIDPQRSLAAWLHLPDGLPPYPTVVIFAGLGSCKEEMHGLARLMVARGIAALVPDMPGNGESLFRNGIPCSGANLSAACEAIVTFVDGCAELDARRLGTCGLCMGGGYAYRACAENTRYRWCATLFPLFINAVDDARTPAWMKSGAWYDFQTGGQDAAAFREEVGWHDHLSIDCPFFMAHSRHDNWMSLERAQVLLEHATSPVRQLVLVDEEPAFASGDSTLHTMPVGEQLCWVGPVLADWIAAQAASMSLPEVAA
jgi:dienelactone hydrolase